MWEGVNHIFLEILNRSITVTYIISAVLLVRFFLRGFPKKYSYALWSIVGLRMIFEFHFSSVMSLFNYVPSSKVEPVKLQAEDTLVNMNTAWQQAQAAGNVTGQAAPAIAGAAAKHVSPVQSAFLVSCAIWISGMLVIAVYALFSYMRIRKNLRKAVRYEGNVYECGNLPSPFVIGLVFPKIYLPFRLGEAEREYILEHERYHIRRKDHLIKMAAFLLVIVYWFHPLVWVSYYFMIQDMEMSCDEAVLTKLGSGIKKNYSESLLSFAAGKRGLTMGPLAFGESSAAKRIKNVLKFKKPKLRIGIAGGFMIVLIAVICLTNADSKQPEVTEQTESTNRADSAGGSLQDGESDAGWEYRSYEELANHWASAFCNRDAGAILSMSTDTALEALEEDELFSDTDGEISFGWSSPWPWDSSQDYYVSEINNAYADIIYYAWDSTPHVTAWVQRIMFSEEPEGIRVYDVATAMYDRIALGSEYVRAYPYGVSGRMDYLTNGVGDVLNTNALEDSSRYEELFSPDTALLSLCNLYDHDIVQIRVIEETGFGQTDFEIYFADDDSTVKISMIQPYGENGIWIPQNYMPNALARFMKVPWEEVTEHEMSYGNMEYQDIVCIGELPEIDLKMYGYNDEDCFGRAVAIDFGGDVTYFDWYYTTSRLIYPQLFWNEKERLLQVSLTNYTGTGLSAQELHVLQQYDTGTLADYVFSYEDYTALLKERLRFQYEQDTKLLTLIDAEQEEEIVTVALSWMEEDQEIVNITAGDISEFVLGENLRLEFTPGCIVEGWAISQYDDLPVLSAPVLITKEGNDITFRLGNITTNAR